MEPRVIKRERRLHLSYEQPQHRIHCAQIYPIAAPNGSTVIIYGYDNGLRILWRGGKRRKVSKSASSHTPSRPNGIPPGTEIIALDSDSDSDEAPPPATSNPPEESRYEDEEDEVDPDSPHLPIIEDLEISVGTDVLHVAVPTLNPSVLALAPEILQSIALIAISSADGALRVIQVPLEPPAPHEKDAVVAEIGQSQIELSAGGPIPADLAVKLVNFAQQKPSTDVRSQAADGALLVATAVQSLKVWQIQISDGELVEPEKNQFKSQPLPAAASKITFHPSPRSAQLLLTDISGAARIYDPFASISPQRRPTSSDSILSFNANKSSSSPGACVMSYYTSLQNPKDSSAPVSPILAHRKKILDAKWILSGKAILTLLSDGEWGIWDVISSPSSSNPVSKRPSSSNSTSPPSTFVSHGFLGSSTTPNPANESTFKSRKPSSRLAPMTPNTRKVKSETLFSGVPKTLSGTVLTGGISVVQSTPKAGQSDESVTIWYAGEIYSIASVQAFWQRAGSGSSTNNNSDGSFGTLYAPGLARISEVNLSNEEITSVSQFAGSKSHISGSGGLATNDGERDLLVSGEKRFVILQSLRPNTPSRVLFQQLKREQQVSQLQQRTLMEKGFAEEEEEEEGKEGDQMMLDAGELDLGGMDRILDGMAGGMEGARGRRVGFAH